MISVNEKQAISDKIYSVYHDKGFVTENIILDAIAEHNLSLDEIDRICDNLLSMGVIIQDSIYLDDNEDDGFYDRSKIDYEKIFSSVIEIDDSIKPFINEVRQLQPPQHREAQNLILQAKAGNVFAKERIINMYLKIVVRIALWHYDKFKLPLADAIQDGCLGLIKALEKFEIGKQDKFSTYAPWWIRQYIMREARIENSPIYFPVHVKDKLFNIYETVSQHYCENCTTNDICVDLIEFVSQKLDCDSDQATEYIGFFQRIESVEELLYLDEHIFSDKNLFEEQTIDDYIERESKERITKILGTLTSREEKVMLLRFGIMDGKERTLELVGKSFSVTRERIRQIEAKALRKLRHPSRSKILKEYY